MFYVIKPRKYYETSYVHEYSQGLFCSISATRGANGNLWFDVAYRTLLYYAFRYNYNVPSDAISAIFCSIWTNYTTDHQNIFSYAKSFNHCDHLNRNRNLKISKALLKSQAHQLIHERCDESKGSFQRGGQEKLRSDIQNTRMGQSSCKGGCRSDGEG